MENQSLYYSRVLRNLESEKEGLLNISRNYTTNPSKSPKSSKSRSLDSGQSNPEKRLLRVPSGFCLSDNRARMFELRLLIQDLTVIVERGKLVDIPMIPAQRRLKESQLQFAKEMLDLRKSLEYSFFNGGRHE